MRITAFFGALAAGVLFLGSAQAALVTIDFTAPNVDLTSETYSEDGFVVDGAGTFSGSVTDNVLLGNFFYADDVFIITREDGGAFRFLSFDYGAQFGGYVSDRFSLVGFFDGAQVADFGEYEGVSATLATQILLSAILIDELRIVGLKLQEVSAVWDNFVFDTASEVPLPAAAPLFFAGLAGVGWMRRKRADAAA